MDPITIGAGMNIPQPRILTSDNGHRPESVSLNGQAVPVQTAIFAMLADIRGVLLEIREAVQSPKEG